ncbi:MAG: urease accessory protein UreF [Pararhodobacter sp.]|nr:urease accessory protein UreF [Pararhodobacter sp.]
MTPLLTLTQWLSPGFPTGAFAYSHGLEQVIHDGVVTDAPSLELWLADVLRYGAGWQDAVLLVQALNPGADLDALDATARALQPGAERLQETLEQGAAFARTVAAVSGRNLPARALPVAVGEAAAPLGLPPEQVVALFVQGFTANLVTIAVRHVPLGQTAGQGVLARLAPIIADIATRTARSTLDALAGSTLAADLAAIRHETKDVRLFRT